MLPCCVTNLCKPCGGASNFRDEHTQLWTSRPWLQKQVFHSYKKVFFFEESRKEREWKAVNWVKSRVLVEYSKLKKNVYINKIILVMLSIICSFYCNLKKVMYNSNITLTGDPLVMTIELSSEVPSQRKGEELQLNIVNVPTSQVDNCTRA